MNLSEPHTESHLYLIIDPKDMECGICYKSYSHLKNQAMLLPCGHSLCSTCLPNISFCPLCRKAISQAPAKNILVASLIEKDAQTKKCAIHKKPKDYFSNKARKLVCCDCILEEHKEEYKPIQKIESKVKEMKAQRQQINQKRQETQAKIQESLNKKRENLDYVVDILFEEELASIFALKKKIKSVLEISNFTDKDRYEHQLVTESLAKHEEKTQTMLEKWDDKEDMAAEILDASLEIKDFLEKYEDKEKEILEDIDEEEKSLEKILQDSKENQINMREILVKLLLEGKPPAAELKPAYSAQIAIDYLLRTLKDYGIHYEYNKGPEQQPLILKENPFFTNLQKFYPKFFECSLKKLHLSCGALSDSRFQTLCEILQNIQNLSNLNVTFENITLEKAELLSNFVLQSKTLEKFSTKMPLLNNLHDPFEKLINMTFPLKNLSALDINYSANNTSITFEQNPSETSETSETLKTCSMRFSRRNLLLHFASSVILPNLSFYKSIQKVQLSFAKYVIYVRFLQDLIQILKNLESLQEIDLGLANVWQLKNHGLTQQISQLISSKKSLTKVSLFLAGKALSKEKVFDDLFSLLHQRPGVPEDHQLEEFALTLMGCDEISMVKIVSYLDTFPKLKKLTLKMNQVNLPVSKITEFLKDIPRLKALKSLEIISRGFMDLNHHNKMALEMCKARLPRSIQSKIMFEKFMAHHVPDYMEIGLGNEREDEGQSEEENAGEAYSHYERDIADLFA